VCLDLEDAVAPAAKERAREAVVRALGGALDLPGRARGGSARLAVRLNHARSEAGRSDAAALAAVWRQAGERYPEPPLLVVPKAELAAGIPELARGVGGQGMPARVVAMIETARGLAEVEEIGGVEEVDALMFGAVDLARDLGCSGSWEALLYARARVVHAAALARLNTLDVPSLELEAPETLERETRAAAALGFTGKAAIHPAQIRPIHRALTPEPWEVEHARRVLAAAKAAGGGVTTVGGLMVDRPVVELARRTLARAAVYTDE